MDQSVRTLPFAEEAEKSVLGSMMIDRSALSVAEEMLRPDDFYSPRHVEIFKAIISLSSRGESVDPLLISSVLDKKDLLETVGGRDYILELQREVGLTSNIKSYCKLVEDKSTQRALIKACDEIMAVAYADVDPTEDIVEFAEKSIFSITQRAHSDGLTRVRESLMETLDTIELLAASDGEITGVTTGLRDLDNHLSGLKKSELVLIAARPSMGKTALGVNMAVAAALKDSVVAIFSLEMGKVQLTQRIMAQLGLVDLGNIITGQIEDWAGITRAVNIMEKIPLYLDDTPSISLTELRAKCRRLKAEEGLDLVVVDYLQLMTVQGRSENRQQEISEISRGLKSLAMELNCPVLALAQLSRAPELRVNKTPILSDLRESGAIEQDADVVMMLYRDDYYNEESERPNVTDVIITKNRNGPTGSVELFFHKEHTKFGDIIHRPEGQEM